MPQHDESADLEASRAADGDSSSRSLFRREARTNLGRLSEGEVRIGTPLTWKLVVGFVIMSLMVSLSIAWFASAPRSERISGIIDVPDGRVVVPAPEAAQVTRIFVASGATVRAGDPLVHLVSRSALMAGPEVELRSQQLLESQLAANRRQAASNESAHRAAAANHVQEAESLERVNAALQGRISMQRQLLAEESANLEDIQGLADRGLITRTALRARRLEVANREEAIAELAERVQSNSARAAAHRAEAARQASQRLEDAGRLDEAHLRLRRELHDRSSSAEAILRSPISGTIELLNVRQAAFIGAGEPLVQIVSSDAAPGAEFVMPAHLRGWIEPGRRVRVQLHELRDVQPGYVDAVVESIEGPLSVRAGEARSSYRMRVTFRNVPVRIRNYLRPGMPVTTTVTQGKESLLQRLFPSWGGG